MTEHIEQTLLFSWAASMETIYPDLACLYAIPNGGLRAKATAAKLKQEGVKRGVLDVHLPVARGGYIGCWIEMKHGRNKPTEDQLLWMERLRRQGHFCTVCYCHEEAEETLEHYLMGYIVKERV